MKTMRKATILYILFIPVLFFGCTKRNTINLELTIVDEETGEPLEAGVVLHYGDIDGLTSSLGHHGEINLGKTDANGQLKVKRDLGRKKNCQLFIYGDKYHRHCIGLQYGFPTEKVGIQKGKKAKKTVKLKPFYHYELKIKNINCFDEMDSVWISVNNEQYMPKYTLDGCVDFTVQYGPNGGLPGISFTSSFSTISFHIKVKRNGQVTEYDEIKQLTRGMITPISIEY